MLILAKNSANTSVAAEKTPLIRDIEFAERERETFCLLIFHLSFLILGLIDTYILRGKNKNVKHKRTRVYLKIIRFLPHLCRIFVPVHPKRG